MAHPELSESNFMENSIGLQKVNEIMERKTS